MRSVEVGIPREEEAGGLLPTDLYLGPSCAGTIDNGHVLLTDLFAQLMWPTSSTTPSE